MKTDVLLRKGKQHFFLLVVLLFSFVFSFNFVSAENFMTVEVNVIDTGGVQSGTGNGTGIVSIEVPTSIDLGDVDEDGFSEEIKVYVNNTGDTDILVTPELISGDDFFENLYFRELKTSSVHPELTEQKKIGSWSFVISAPTAEYRSKYFYMQLDLSNSGLDVDSDLIGYEADVRFIATAQYKKILSVVLFLFFVNIVSGYQLGANPSALEIDLNPGDRVCKNIEVFSDYGNLIIQDRWSAISSNDLKNFIYTAQSVGVEVDTPLRVSKKNEDILVCFQIQDRYQYNGVLVFYSQENKAGVGVWIRINKGNEIKVLKTNNNLTRSNKEDKISRITNNIILEDFSGKSFDYIIFLGEILFIIVSFGVLLFLIWIKKRRRHFDID